ncbi:MAG: hypothetical protein LBB36_00625 [Fibromonadaceae bacterium]|jgi:hypothetical protein|nr:hypothetical protein [Fibromonadaceae bacterium]
MFRLFVFVIAAVLAFAKDWVHYTRQNEIRDLLLADSGTLWAAFAWGLQERLPNNTENTYMPGNNGLAVADFAQLFDLPNGDIIAASKTGILVRKSINSKNFETISSSYAEKKRNLLPGLGKRAENILILPFEGALAFFDYEQNNSVITISQIGTSPLEKIEKIAVEGNAIWVKLPNNLIWKREINWKGIHSDLHLADPNSWKPDNNFPEEAKPSYNANFSSLPNFPLERVKVISIVSGGDALAWTWGNDNDNNYFSKMKDGEWGEAFYAKQVNYGNDHEAPFTASKALALLPNGNFAVGMWGPGLITYDNSFPAARMKDWFHPNNGKACPTKYADISNDGWTIVQGLVSAPDYSGFIFSYFSETNYGLGIAYNDGRLDCPAKASKNSSTAASSIIARKNETGELEVYVAWKSDGVSREGGVDYYLYPKLQENWALPFGSPIDFAFDSKGILWAVSSSKIFYLDDNEWKEPGYIRGFSGSTISSLQADAQNGLWIGTGDGAYLFSRVGNSPDSLTAKQFRIKDGLLNETVHDIAIDTIKGKVYFAHDLGLSVYSTNLVRSSKGYMQGDAPKPIAYPNPFRPGLHQSVKIDYISEKSSVYILDSSGKRVRFFSGKDLRGGTVIWDGKNENGKPVAPGLYHYLAADGKKTAKGKILVER